MKLKVVRIFKKIFMSGHFFVRHIKKIIISTGVCNTIFVQLKVAQVTLGGPNVTKSPIRYI